MYILWLRSLYTRFQTPSLFVRHVRLPQTRLWECLLYHHLFQTLWFLSNSFMMDLPPLPSIPLTEPGMPPWWKCCFDCTIFCQKIKSWKTVCEFFSMNEYYLMMYCVIFWNRDFVWYVWKITIQGFSLQCIFKK